MAMVSAQTRPEQARGSSAKMRSSGRVSASWRTRAFVLVVLAQVLRRTSNSATYPTAALISEDQDRSSDPPPTSFTQKLLRWNDHNWRPTHIPLRRGLHVTMKPAIFSERWLGPANLDRAGLRISGMDTYALVASVLLQVLMGLYGVIAEPEEAEKDKLHRYMYEAQMGLMALAVLCSTFTMVMFLLNKVYTITALSMYKDVTYEIFRHATGRHRFNAFWSLMVAMSAFLGAFSLNLFTRVKGQRGLIATGFALLGACYLLLQWKAMMNLANEHIFTS